jgi:uncharacterized protein
MRSLFDVNVLIALLDSAHIGHHKATRWLAGQLSHGWASCPLTQNGTIRVMSQPAYPGTVPAAEVAARLAEAGKDPAHLFWPDDVSLLDDQVLNWARVLGHRQVTDNYLLALAVRHRGRFVTFDTRVDGSAVKGAKASHLVVIT